MALFTTAGVPKAVSAMGYANQLLSRPCLAAREYPYEISAAPTLTPLYRLQRSDFNAPFWLR